MILILLFIYFFKEIDYLKNMLKKIIINSNFDDTSKQESIPIQSNNGNVKKSDFIQNLNNDNFSNSNDRLSNIQKLNLNLNKENITNPPLKSGLNKKKISTGSISTKNRSKSMISQIIEVNENKTNIKNVGNEIKKNIA